MDQTYCLLCVLSFFRLSLGGGHQNVSESDALFCGGGGGGEAEVAVLSLLNVTKVYPTICFK